MRFKVIYPGGNSHLARVIDADTGETIKCVLDAHIDLSPKVALLKLTIMDFEVEAEFTASEVQVDIVKP